MAFFMSVSVSDELQLFAQEIQSFLSPNTLRNLARDVGFVQRTSKYQAKDLIALCVWVSQNVAMRDTCWFGIKFNQKYPPNPYFKLNDKNPF